jgi:hypothetical protein
VSLREEEEDEEDAENDQAQDEPAGPAIPGAAAVCASVVSVGVVVAAGNVVSRVSKVVYGRRIKSACRKDVGIHTCCTVAGGES